MSERTAKTSVASQGRANGNNAVEPEAGKPDHPDFRSLLTCLKVFCGALIIAGFVYWLTGDKKVAAGICGAVGVLLTLWHTPFGLFLLFVLFALENAIVLSPSFTISKAMGIVILISFVLRLFSRNFVFPSALKLIVIIGLWSCLSLLWSLDMRTASITLQTFMLYIGFCFIVVNAVRDYKTLQVLLASFVLGSLITSCMLLFGQVAYESGSAETMGRGALVEELSVVVLGRAIAFGFLSACIVFFSEKKFLKKIILAMLALFFLALVTKTQSRTPLIVCFAAPILSFLLCTQSKKRLKALFVGALISLVALIAINVIFEKTNLMSNEAKERFFGAGLEESGRLNLWEQAGRAFLKRPLHGYGINNAHLALDKDKGFSAHNTFFAVLVDLGLVGFSLFALLFLIIYRGVMKIHDFRFKWLGMTMLLYPPICGLTSVIYGLKDFWYAIMLALVCITIDAREKPNLSAGT